MLDKLDVRILEIINNASSIVRSISEKEIEVGVLFPSVTTLDIKRNLPTQIELNVIKGRLNSLKDEGYIYFDSERWWLTEKGKEIIGKSDSNTSFQTTSLSKPMGKILEETFSRFETQGEETFQHQLLLVRRDKLLKEMKELEEKVIQKKAELKNLNKILSKD
jgi:hypothetical protein